MKKWTDNEIEDLINLNREGKTNVEISLILNRTEKSIKVKISRFGLKSNVLNKREIIICSCCGKNFEALISDNRKYCSQSCAAKINNKKCVKRKKINDIKYAKRKSKELVEHKCLYCGNGITSKKFCNSSCQHKYYNEENKKKIESGDTTLDHRIYKKYLIETYGEKCMKCGWDEKNVITGNVPIELEHIDGNSENNLLENLKLLCPNCHSLTPTYKSLNNGNGRYKRRKRYQEGKSY